MGVFQKKKKVLCATPGGRGGPSQQTYNPPWATRSSLQNRVVNNLSLQLCSSGSLPLATGLGHPPSGVLTALQVNLSYMKQLKTKLQVQSIQEQSTDFERK